VPDGLTSAPVSTEEARERSLPDDVRQLARHARALAEAELALNKARAKYAGAQAKGIALLGVLAATLVFLAVVAAVFGAVLALTPTLGAWGATGAVCGGLLLVAFVLLLVLRARVRIMNAVLGSGDVTP